MTTRNFEFAEQEYYHIYNRGVDKRTIYTTPSEYRRFLDLLYAANGTHDVDMRHIAQNFRSVYDWDRGDEIVAIGAFCLMPNHFHILLTPLKEGGVAKYMSKLSTSYAMYFNRRHERTGALFEGKFKAKHADTDEYLKYLYAYIHLNPVKLIQSDWKENGIRDVKKAYEYSARYPYSSLSYYLNENEERIVSPNYFPEYFSTAADHTEELLSWLYWDEEGM